MPTPEWPCKYSIAWRWCRRKPALARALGACALALLLGILGITWQWKRAEAEALLNKLSGYKF